MKEDSNLHTPTHKWALDLTESLPTYLQDNKRHSTWNSTTDADAVKNCEYKTSIEQSSFNKWPEKKKKEATYHSMATAII